MPKESVEKLLASAIEQVYDTTMFTGGSSANKLNSDGDSAAATPDAVEANSEGSAELDELVGIAAQRCRLDHRESVLLAEIAQSDLCDRLHGHTPNAWYADRTRQARSAASAASSS